MKLSIAIAIGLLVFASLLFGCSTSTDPQSNNSNKDAKMEFVPIPAGSFMMGSDNGQNNEKPAHNVRISRRFEMGKYEVTQAQWLAVMGTNPSSFRGPNLPVESVTWDEVQVFIGRLNARNDDYMYRLPTEAEWEYAARAGTTNDFAENLDAVAWYAENSGKTTHPVGTKQSNKWGVFDMEGNVTEWCQDFYDRDYYKNSPTTDPGGPSTGLGRVIRGSCWFDTAQSNRLTGRNGAAYIDRSYNLGFRLVRISR